MGPIKAPKSPRSTQRPIRGLLFCGLLISLSLAAHAQSSGQSPAQQNPSQQPPAPLAETDPAPPGYTQALQALQSQDFERAARLLQQVVAQHPEWAGAWLDLALIALRQGQYAQAEEFLLALEERFAPLPLLIGQTVQQLRQQIQLQRQTEHSQTTTVRVRQNMLALATGYETNANAGLQLSTLTLNLPNGDAIVNIDPSSRARSAHSVRATWAQYGQQALGQGSITWQIQTQARQYSLSALNHVELLAQTTLAQPELPGRITAGWQNIWLGGQNVYQAPLLRWQFDARLGPQCSWQNHIQAEDRQHLRASHLDTHWHALRTTWRCQKGQQRSQIVLQAAHETAATDRRPGGDSQHRLWGLQHEWLKPFGRQDHHLLVRLDVLHTQDSATYSPLLDNGRPRQLRRQDASLNWSAPVPAQAPWRWSLGMHATRQNSNIQFFKQDNYALETSIWRAW